MKSTSSFASFAHVTVARSIVPPIFTTTEPSACFASLPVSISIILPSDNSIVFFTIFIISSSTCLPLWELLLIDLFRPYEAFPASKYSYVYMLFCPTAAAGRFVNGADASLRKKGGYPFGCSPFVGSYYDVAYRRRPSSLTIALYLSMSTDLR